MSHTIFVRHIFYCCGAESGFERRIGTLCRPTVSNTCLASISHDIRATYFLLLWCRVGIRTTNRRPAPSHRLQILASQVFHTIFVRHIFYCCGAELGFERRIGAPRRPAVSKYLPRKYFTRYSCDIFFIAVVPSWDSNDE